MRQPTPKASKPLEWRQGGRAGWWLIYDDGSKLPYTSEQAARFEARTELILPIAESDNAGK